MKKSFLTTAIIAVFVTSFMFTSCKKTEVSIDENVINSSKTELTLIDNSFSISGNLIPEDFSVGTVDIKVTSTADPIGFTFTSSLLDKEEKDGKYLYLSKSFYATISASDTTYADDRYIAVSPEGDVIKINIGDGIYETSVNIDCQSILKYELGNYPSLKIYGASFTGNEREAISVATDRVPNPRLIKLDLNQQKGFDYYSRSFSFHDGDFSQYDGSYWIGIEVVDEAYTGSVYLKYYDQEISTSYGESGTYILSNASTK